MTVVVVNDSNQYLVEHFIKHAGDSLSTFRYFSKRPFSVLKNHLITLITVELGEPVCYGHLDQEDGVVWLGIAVIDSEIKKGWGTGMMAELIRKAKELKLNQIFLSVDNDNLQARHLYEKHGFKMLEKHEKSTIYGLTLALDIAISTIAFMKRPLSEAIQIAVEENFKLEFSSGVPYFPEIKETFLNAPIPKLLHNYFPPPELPFVLNLASDAEIIRQRSIQHCLQGLQLTAKIGAPFFSAHAGFCIDPDCSELGRKLTTRTGFHREKNWTLFIDSVTLLLDEADRLGVSFLIENNVLASMNQYEDGTNPLLCADLAELMQLVREINHPRFGLLLDTGHLKVSGSTLRFSIKDAVETLAPFIQAIHHSDNDGMEDTNDAFDEQYWFLPYMKSFQEATHVLEVKKQSPMDLKRQMALLNSACTFQQSIHSLEHTV